MKKLFIFTVLFLQLLFSYTLVVTKKADVNKLKTIGVKCVYDSVNQNYKCIQSNNLQQLKQIQGYMKKEYNISSFISQEKNINPAAPVKKEKTVKNVQKSFTNPPAAEMNAPVVNVPKKGYCIQVASSKYKKGILKLFSKYYKKPVARVEKIGSEYVIRIGESKNYYEIKKLYKSIHKGFIRKCDYIPSRIVKTSSEVNVQPISSNNVKVIKSLIVKNNKVTVNAMYNALNSGDLITAKRMAEKLKNTKYSSDAYNVLGIVAMKMGKWGEACKYLYRSKNRKLLNTACYTDNLKKGYAFLQTNPKASLNYFYRAKRYQNTKNIEAGIGYAYLNMKKYKKAESIFAQLYKKYPDDKNIIKGYALALYNMKEFNRLKSLQAQIPAKYAKELQKYDVYMSLDNVNKLMKEKKYNEAEKILLSLYNKSPDNVSVLLTLGNLYLQKNEPDKAENFFKNVLIINPENIYALEGLKGAELKKGNYKKALGYIEKLKKLGLNEDDTKVKTMYYLQMARKNLKNQNCSLATKDINQLININAESADYYMVLGDYYSICQHNKRKAFIYYEKGYQVAKDNFAIKIKFLYSLLHYNMFTQIKIVLSTINVNKLTPKQKKELKDFYDVLYLKYAQYKFQNKDYNTAIAVAKQGLSFDVTNADLYGVIGWSCFRLKKYECAKENFEKENALKPQDKVKYALALTYMKMGQKKKAENILDQIASTNDPELRMKIADAYLNLGLISKAEQITNSVKVNKTYAGETNATVTAPQKIVPEKVVPAPQIHKKEFFPNVFGENEGEINNYKVNDLYNYEAVKPILITAPEDNKLYNDYEKMQKKILKRKSDYLSYLEAGLNVRSKSGTSGTDKLTDTVVYLNGKYYFNYENSVYFKLGLINLSSGGLSNYSLVGSGGGLILNDDWVTECSGFIPKIGYSHEGDKIINVELGSTPMGCDTGVSSTFTGKLSFGFKKNNKKMLVTFLREPVKDSLLSYVGNSDPYSNATWGRVISNGLKFEFQKTLDTHDSMIYASFGVASLKGKDTVNNTKYEVNIFPLKYIGNDMMDSDYLGVFCMFEGYQYNERKFYYPNGGYFSPEYFMLIAPRYEGYMFGEGKKFGIKAFLMGGPIIYNEDNSNSFTLGLEGGVYTKYIVQKNLVVKGGMDLRKSTDYTDFYVNIALQYYFGDKVYVSKEELNNNMKEMLKTW